MNRLGLLGGMSWQSTALYYSYLNQGINEVLGGVHSCELVLHSFDFHEIKDLQVKGDWNALNAKLCDAALGLKHAGCDTILICTNTMHKWAAYIEENIGVKILHIVDAITHSLRNHNLNKVGFLGTKYAMEEDFLHAKYRSNGIETIIPDEKSRAEVHRIIFDELVNGIINEDSRNSLIKICNDLFANGAQGIIAGCTEIELILRPQDIEKPLFESTRLHCEMALRHSLKI